MFIAQSELFKNVSRGALDVIEGYGSEKTYPKGEVVFREGDRADSFYVLVEGAVHVVMGDDEQLCFIVDRPGDVVGWSALLEPYSYQATAYCMSPARIVVFPRAAVDLISRFYPADGMAIFRNLAAIATDKLRQAYQNVVDEDGPWR